jgi:hypothetical protein
MAESEEGAGRNEQVAESGQVEPTVAGTDGGVLPGSGKAGDFAGFENGASEPVLLQPPGLVPPATVAATVAAAPRSLFLARIIQALWFGSGVFVMFAALAVFRALPSVDAADAVGAMLSRWHYIALLAPALLTLIEFRRARTRMVMILFVAILLAAMQGFSDLRIRRMRAESPVAISSLDRNDPLRRRFGALHGLSSILLVAQIAAAAAAIAAEPDRDV